jgi:predicted NBD/HSP70 family sugar kinase
MIALGIDIGGTFTKFVAINEVGKILKQDKIATPIKYEGNRFLEELSGVILKWKKELKKAYSGKEDGDVEKIAKMILSQLRRSGITVS